MNRPLSRMDKGDEFNRTVVWLDDPDPPEQVAGEHQVAVGEFSDLDGAERHEVVVRGADVSAEAGDVRRTVLVEDAALREVQG